MLEKPEEAMPRKPEEMEDETFEEKTTTTPPRGRTETYGSGAETRGVHHDHDEMPVKPERLGRPKGMENRKPEEMTMTTPPRGRTETHGSGDETRGVPHYHDDHHYKPPWGRTETFGSGDENHGVLMITTATMRSGCWTM